MITVPVPGGDPLNELSFSHDPDNAVATELGMGGAVGTKVEQATLAECTAKASKLIAIRASLRLFSRSGVKSRASRVAPSQALRRSG